jgi:uridine kinase
MTPKRSIVIGIAGGSGSGKSTIAERIVADIPGESLAILGQDNYYHDLRHLQLEERHKVNFDHPDAFDNALLIRHIEELRAGRPVQRPIYNYVTHLRREETITVQPAPIIVVEGILVLVDPELRRRMDIRLFVDCDADERFIRRLNRDVRERGRSLESVVEQYLKVVRPMHLEFVEPSKRHADVIIPVGGHNEIAIDMVATKIRSTLST